MKRQQTLVFTLVVLAFVFPSASADVKSDLVVEDAWVRLGPSIVKVHAGYFSIINQSSDKSFRLVGVKSDLFEKVEMHNTSLVDGMMRMEHLHYVDIQAGKKIQFSTSGKHLMLINKRKPIKEGDLIPVTLILNDDQFIDVEMKVKR